MAKEKKLNLKLPEADNLFSTQEERDEAKLKKIYEIPLSEIDSFPEHPFKVKDDDDMTNLIESIRERGILTPVILRKKDDGRYEMLSGHRRKRACEYIGLETIRAEIVELDKDAATILMVDSNLQRTTILPSEKAFSYKMRLEAMKRQGQRNDLTSSLLGTKLIGGRSDKILSETTGESKNTIYRYIRLTELIPELLQLVDDRKLGMYSAVEISYIPKDLQEEVYFCIETNEASPAFVQAREMRKLSDAGSLDMEKIHSIMVEEKPNQKEKFTIAAEKINKYIPNGLSRYEREEYVVKAMEHYRKFLQRKDKEFER